MSNSSKNFTEEEKAAIALKAASGKEGTLQELADEHGVSAEEIRNWMRESGVENVNDEDEDNVIIDVTEDYGRSVEYGATYDIPNYKRIVFWSAFGTGLVLLIVLSVFYVHSYTINVASDQSAQQSQFYDIQQLQERDSEILNNFGVVDADEGVYRIPIDQAISEIVNENNE